LNRKLKDALQSTFEAPNPMNKEKFLRELNYPKTTYKEFFISQMRYIRKRVWCFCILLVVGVFAINKCMNNEVLLFNNAKLMWPISAILPFLALLSVTELFRSLFYNIEELEMSCRYRLLDVVIAKATILGIGNITAFIAILFVVDGNCGYGLLRTSLYLILPYLMTCFGSILVLKHVRGRESLYYCGLVACLVSVMEAVTSVSKQIVYNENFLGIWSVLCLTFLILIFVQMSGFVMRMEEISGTNY
jgi:hypothetical protein